MIEFRVNRKELFEVLKDEDVSSKMRSLENIYKLTKIRMRIGNKLSDHATINSGVCQGYRTVLCTIQYVHVPCDKGLAEN